MAAMCTQAPCRWLKGRSPGAKSQQPVGSISALLAASLRGALLCCMAVTIIRAHSC